jgi:hypothetical protein
MRECRPLAVYSVLRVKKTRSKEIVLHMRVLSCIGRYEW